MSALHGFKMASHGIITREYAGHTEVLLGKRINTSYGDGQYSFPAGHIELLEPPHIALKREMKEELGVVPRFNSMAAQSPVLVLQHLKDYEKAVPEAQRFRHYTEYFFRVGAWDGEIHNAEPNKCADLRFFPLDDLPRNTLPLARHAMQHIRHGHGPFGEFGWQNPDFPAWQKKYGQGPA